MFNRNIWNAIGNKKHCSFNLHTKHEVLCKNKYNLTGICNEYSCPLANTEYATVILDGNKILLCIKSDNKWTETELSYDYLEALKTIDFLLSGFDKDTIDKCKNRLTKHFECLERWIELEKNPDTKLIVNKKKMNRREKIRALKALHTINFEKDIGDELMERLKSGIYGDELQDKYLLSIEKAKNYKKKKYVTEFEQNITNADTTKSRKKSKSKKKSKQLEW